MHEPQRIELAALFLGLLLSTGVFAVKAAVGGWHCVALHGKRRPWLPLLLLLPYLLLFKASHWLLTTVGLGRLSEYSLRYFGVGVILHLLMCAGLVAWGYRLLTRQEEHCHTDRSWMLLAFPCPVCASAVLLACVMAQLLYPTASGLLRWLLPLAFAVLYAAAFATLHILRRLSGTTPLRLAGWMMLFIAAYFTLLLLISPQWTQLDRIYALARHGVPPDVSSAGFWWMLAAIAAFFAAGFARTAIKRNN